MTTKLLQDEPSKFEDSNDSFEIPETQVFPPTDHQDDELDSEGFVAMPDEEIEENDYSQSQALLQGIDLERNLQEFEDSDTIDLEISKLEWDDSTKNNDKDNDDTDSVAVTPDLDFGAFSTSDANVITELHSPKQSKVTSEISSLERNEVSNCSFDGVSIIQNIEKGKLTGFVFTHLMFCMPLNVYIKMLIRKLK